MDSLTCLELSKEQKMRKLHYSFRGGPHTNLVQIFVLGFIDDGAELCLL
jgi:hypothetical protein